MIQSFINPMPKPEPVFSTNFLLMCLDESQRYLEAKWRRPVCSAEFREGMRAIFNCITEHKVERLLLDLSDTGSPSAADQSWLVRRLLSANAGTSLRRSARIYSGDILQLVISEVITARVETFPYETQFFHQEDAAREWLLQ